MAEGWIARHEDERASGRQYVFAIERADEGLLVGAIALRPVPNEHENLGYWIGREYWGLGYATGATRAMIALAFNCLDCQQLIASHLERNPASGRVMEKCGLVLVRREARDHRGALEEFCIRGITRDAWEQLG